jgi:Predicted hydrolases of HD superfamily
MEKYKGIEDFYNLYIKLEETIRAGWIIRNIPTERLKDVSNHTLQVVMLANVFCRELKLDYDLLRLMEMCFIHDVGESIIGDVSELDKDYEEKKSGERQAVIEVLDSLSSELSVYYFSLWEEYEEKITPLGRFCYEVDKIAAVMRAKKYAEEFNMPEVFRSFYDREEGRKTFDQSPLKEMFESLNI